PVVVLIVGKMDRATRELDAVAEHGVVYVMPVKPFPAKCGNKGGMDVHDAAGEIIRNTQELQESGQAHEVGPSVAAKPEELCTKVLHRGAFLASHDGRRNAGALGTR